MPMIQSRIVPTARNGPCALAAAIPPMVAFKPFHGLSGKDWLFSKRACSSCPSVMPASTWTVRSAGLYSVIRESRVRSTAQSARRSGFPKYVCVSAPIGTIAPFSAERACASSSMDSGRRIVDGERLSMIGCGFRIGSRLGRTQRGTRDPLLGHLGQEGWLRHKEKAAKPPPPAQTSRTRGGKGEVPSLAKEGWPRHQVNGPVPLEARPGWFVQLPIIGGLNQPFFLVSPYRAHIRSAHARLRPLRRLRGIFLMGAATPPCPRRGLRLSLQLFSMPPVSRKDVGHGKPKWERDRGTSQHLTLKSKATI